ncbi:hypothetical protein BDR26DRAFT_859386 [Obelidium mucronatum]|nr:hypothetical protein BDR26DRAFT_859386 [Obelidium mucronatum]
MSAAQSFPMQQTGISESGMSINMESTASLVLNSLKLTRETKSAAVLSSADWYTVVAGGGGVRETKSAAVLSSADWYTVVAGGSGRETKSAAVLSSADWCIVMAGGGGRETKSAAVLSSADWYTVVAGGGGSVAEGGGVEGRAAAVKEVPAETSECSRRRTQSLADTKRSTTGAAAISTNGTGLAAKVSATTGVSTGNAIIFSVDSSVGNTVTTSIGPRATSSAGTKDGTGARIAMAICRVDGTVEATSRADWTTGTEGDGWIVVTSTDTAAGDKSTIASTGITLGNVVVEVSAVAVNGATITFTGDCVE